MFPLSAERCPLMDSPHAYAPDHTRIRPMWFRSTATIHNQYSALRTCLRDTRCRGQYWSSRSADFPGEGRLPTLMMATSQLSKVWPWSDKAYRLEMLRDWKVWPIGENLGDSAKGRKRSPRLKPLGMVAKGWNWSPKVFWKESMVKSYSQRVYNEDTSWGETGKVWPIGEKSWG